MVYRSTIAYSLITAGVVTLALVFLPGDPVWWGFGLVIAGLIVFATRR